jgi:hypothetical protein
VLRLREKNRETTRHFQNMNPKQRLFTAHFIEQCRCDSQNQLVLKARCERKTEEKSTTGQQADV